MFYIRKDGTYYEGDQERPDDQLVHQRPSPDYTFDGWTWVMPPITAKRISDTTVNEQRDAALLAGVTYNGHVYDSDIKSIMNVAMTACAINSGMALPQGFVWRSQDNKNVPFTADDVKGLLFTMIGTGFAIYAASWAQKDKP